MTLQLLHCMWPLIQKLYPICSLSLSFSISVLSFLGSVTPQEEFIFDTLLDDSV